MPSLLDHVRCCHSVCVGLLTDYLKPEPALRERDDFANGKRNQITQCLLSMSHALEDIMNSPQRFLTIPATASLRAEFLLTAIGETALRKNYRANVEAPPGSFPKEDAFEETLRKILGTTDTKAPSNCRNFEAYARGCEEGNSEFCQKILPAMIRNYQARIGDIPSPPRRGYRM